MRPFASSLLLLALVGVPGFAADDDPEPPGGRLTLQSLKGKWVFAHRILRGQKTLADPIHYQFDGNRYSCESNGGKLRFGGTVKIEKGKQIALVMTIDNSVLVLREGVKMANGELHFVHLRPGVWADFSGKRTMVVVLKREKQ